LMGCDRMSNAIWPSQPRLHELGLKVAPM
jgi:hypothetical protein